MNKLNIFQSIMIWMAGFDQKTAKQCTTSEIGKMVISGSLVIITPLIGLFSYGFAFYFIFNSMTAAIIGGLVSATVLLFIERSIMGYGRPGSYPLGMIARVFLALTVSFMLAEPIILKVFEDSITEQQFRDINTKQEIAAEPFDMEIKDIKDALKQDETRLHQLQRAYTLEMDGQGSDRGVGQGAIYSKKLEDYNDFKTQYENRLAIANDRIAEIKEHKRERLQQIAAHKADGLIGKMRALNQLGEKEPIVKWTTWLLRIFFVLIELSPLLIKITPSGDRGLYYKLVDIQDLERENVVNGLSKERENIILKEEQLRYVTQYEELSQQEMTIFSNSKGKDAVQMMDRVLAMAEKKMEAKQRAAKKINDETLLDKVYIQIDTIFEGFLKTIDQMKNGSNSNYSSASI